jgi:hypothetical protein
MVRIKWRKLVQWLALIAFLLLASFVMLIHLDPVQQFALRRVESMARVAGYPFKAQHVRLKPFELEAAFTGFVYDYRGVRAEADELRVDFPRNVFTRDGIALNTLWARGVRLTIKPAEPAGEAARIPRFVIRRLDIQDGSLSYTDADTRIEAPKFDLRATEGPGTLQLRQPLTVSGTSIEVGSVPVNLSPDRVSFGPVNWSARYGKYSGNGLSRGVVRWAPTVAAVASFSTGPLDVENWKDVNAQGLVRYEDDVLHIDDFRAERGSGILTATARLAEKENVATLMWHDVSTAPLNVAGNTSGDLQLRWGAFDLKNIAGQGHVRVATSEYGNANSDVEIRNGRAHLRLHALSYGADIRGNVNTGLDRRVSGTFEATHRQYGLVTARGKIAGTFDDPRVEADIRAADVTYKDIGPLNGTARASYRDRTLDITDIMAALRNSSIPNGHLHVDLRSRLIEGAIPQFTLNTEDFAQDARGVLQASATISGSIDNPMAALTASSTGIDIGGTHIDSVQADATLAGSVLQIARVNATQGEGSLQASGTVDLKTEQTQGQIKVSDFRLTNVRDLSAVVNLNADISGPYRNPYANVKGEMSDLIYAKQPHGSVVFSGTADTQSVKLRLESAKYKAVADTVVSAKSPYAFTATVQATQSPVTYETYSATADGRADARGTLQPATLDSVAFERFTLTGEGIKLRADGSLESGMNVAASANLA